MTDEKTIENDGLVVETHGEGKKFHTFGLSECAKFDMENHARESLTGWGKICKERFENRKSKRGVARRERKGR